MLSPLPWWNDLFVNVPLALAFAWIISWFVPSLFTASFVVGYWLTNVLGFVLLHKGGEVLISNQPSKYTRKSFLKDAAISLLYTMVILLLIRFKVVQPLPEYLTHR
ncbi:MAG TPA: hypothetical protein VFA77_14510 [Candidatus Eisenbacteria bacterium]|nr:hypothetical protein [Candidatus Eisenbacteria bacterium]